MRFNTVSVSTLFVKVSFKKSPYANNLVAVRVVAHNFAEFTSNKALFLVDLPPTTTTLAHVNEVVESLRVKANSLNVSVKMPSPVYKKLAANNF